jgi:FixJ family two-component response regulator
MELPEPQDMPTVYIVEDDVSMRESLEGLIRETGRHVIAFPSARAFLSHPRRVAPSCLILDLTLPDLNGLELQREIAADQPGVPIIFITGHGDIPTSVRAMKAGAIEFLTKPFLREDILNAVGSALDQSAAAVRELRGSVDLRNRFASLSSREREVMRLVVSGLMNKQIAAELGISIITVKVYRGRVMRKMKANTLADLVKLAGGLGLKS